MKWSSFFFKREAVWLLLFPLVPALLGVLIVIIVLFLRWIHTP